MILCITPNPAIDRTLVVPGLAPGSVHRAHTSIVAAGGKGLNAARAIRTLGGAPLCMGFAGGHSGRLLADLARKDGLPTAWTWTHFETRTCTILVSQEQDATVINEPGPAVTGLDWGRLKQDVRAQGSRARFACISGSLPPDSPPESFRGLLDMLVSEGKQVWVDTSGTPLRIALAQPGLSIKVNASEIGEAVGLDATADGLAQRALEMLNAFRLRALAITLGSSGAFLATRQGSWQAEGPDVRVVSTVGSGDAFLGGLVNALHADKSHPEALREAVAAGTANALLPGGGEFRLQDFHDILRQVQVHAL